MFLTEEEARGEGDKKKLGVKEMWYRLQIVAKKRERNQKGVWKNKKRRMTHKVKVNDNQLRSRSNSQEEVKVKKKVIPDEVISVLLFLTHPIVSWSRCSGRKNKLSQSYQDIASR